LTNFAVDLFSEMWSLRRHKTPLFVPMFLACFFVALAFSTLLVMFDWMLSWRIETVRLAGRVIIGLTCFGLMFWALFQVDNIIVVLGLLFLGGVIWQQILTDLFALIAQLRRSS